MHDEELRVDWTTLWLPLPSRRATWIVTALVALYYLVTMSRDLSFYDSAELAMVAVQGGLSHPPGHPLHTMLGWLAAKLTWFRPLLGINALSALPAALAVVPMTSLAAAMTRDSVDRRPRWIRRGWLLPALIGALVFTPAFWEAATRVEVYPLAAALALWAVAKTTANLNAASSGPRTWLVVGLALGFCASTNPMIASITAISITPILLVALVRGRLGWPAMVSLLGGGLVGLTPYLWIPLVADRQDVFVWGAPTGGEALHRYLVGADFTGKRGELTAEIMAQNAFRWLKWAGTGRLAPLFVLGGIANLLWGHRAALGRGCLLISLGLTVTFLSSNLQFSPDIPDYFGYLMVPSGLLLSGTAALLFRAGRGGKRRELLAATLAVALVMNAVTTSPTVLSRTRSQDRVARELAQGALSHAPEEAILLMASDHWVFPLLYLQEVEGRREDVVILPRGLSGASWYWDMLFRRHPRLNEFPLRGPGGQPARIRRFFAVNASRPVLYESWGQAAGIGRRPTCAGPWLIREDDSCPSSDDELSSAVRQMTAQIGRGSPSTDAVLANVSLTRGEALWRLGHPLRALTAFRAGVPSDVRPPRPMDLELERVPRPPPRLPRWDDGRAIGHHSRNLFITGGLLAEAGEERLAVEHFAAAANEGSPAAQRLLSAASREHARGQ